ncbi:uncharacterized protein LOC112693597, partial [Sipha flava]|uniref:Uncharacterized protein LOC112693597 n=2 Tax=Sipha flava TaxID=143950 RepID=A0A8B8GNE0_9HEMI
MSRFSTLSSQPSTQPSLPSSYSFELSDVSRVDPERFRKHKWLWAVYVRGRKDWSRPDVSLPPSRPADSRPAAGGPTRASRVGRKAHRSSPLSKTYRYTPMSPSYSPPRTPSPHTASGASALTHQSVIEISDDEAIPMSRRMRFEGLTTTEIVKIVMARKNKKIKLYLGTVGYSYYSQQQPYFQPAYPYNQPHNHLQQLPYQLYIDHHNSLNYPYNIDQYYQPHGQQPYDGQHYP